MDPKKIKQEPRSTKNKKTLWTNKAKTLNWPFKWGFKEFQYPQYL